MESDSSRRGRRLVLASGSPTRAGLLQAAGIDFDVELPAVDEQAVKSSFSGTSRELAAALAEVKGRAVAVRRPGDCVLAADQVLDLGGEVLSKPTSNSEAQAQLRRLRGREHHLVTAACLLESDRVGWRHVAVARLTVRDFSDEFLAWYLSSCGDRILHTVGSYEIEGRGVQLFSALDGDHFTILGLPVPELLEALRERGLALR